MKILVTAAQGPAGQSVVRLLEDDPRVEVIAVDAATGDVPMASDQNYIPEIQRFVAEHDISYILPCSDEEAFALRESVSSFGPNDAFTVIAPSRSTVRKVRDKWILYQHCQLHRIPVAPFFLGGFVKPCIGRGSRDTITVPPTHLVCRYLPGDEYSVDALFWYEELIASVTRLRRVTRDGICLEADVVKRPDIDKVMYQLQSTLFLHGIVNIQFICSGRDEPNVTDLNPRPGGGLTISAQAGVNLPRLLVSLLRKEPLDGQCTSARLGSYSTMIDPRRRESVDDTQNLV